ncbi:MAG: tRNA 2-thiouridine(34) synthase MnmA [Candidatus Omnitrophica bacterium]|nr:tRNA 2-thiouridine(34) synthase MnmA [Candidatus Omnitrophota bacterium]
MSIRRNFPNKKIVVGMSGGVDSSLAAAILKKKGYDVIGMTFRMWPKEECGNAAGRACCSLESIARARQVAFDLGIPYYVTDLSEDFKKDVIDYFCNEYLRGRTPNPCVVCNEKIKFGRMLEKATSLGASLIATGHYARIGIEKVTGKYLLREGKDKERDQSYFLFSLSQDQLRHTLFPLGGILKKEARRLAKKMRLKTYDAISSQDVCFTGGQGYAEYIKRRTGVEIRKGDIVDGDGKVLGSHKGIPFYTIGQRRGLGITHAEPLYVVGLDIDRNRIIVGTKKAVMKKRLVAENVKWIAIDGIGKPMRVMAKIRYNHKKARATVTSGGGDTVTVEFDEPQEAPTPGQAVVFYDKDVVLGGGWIRQAS